MKLYLHIYLMYKYGFVFVIVELVIVLATLLESCIGMMVFELTCTILYFCKINL